jgi:secondary thiamine-phosphate synthase enzyme
VDARLDLAQERAFDGNVAGENGSADAVGGCYRAGGAAVKASGVVSGICYVYVPHTTAGVAINEHADPDVAADLEGVFDRVVPQAGPYRHSEGNTDSHAKAVMVGASQVIFVEEGKLLLGRWQGIFFCEFDGPRERKMFVKVEGQKS